MIDRRPLMLTVRALRCIFADGESVAAGEITVMETDLALAAVSAGRVEVVGPHAERVRTTPVCEWITERASSSPQQPSAWMQDGIAPDPRRPVLVGAGR